MDISWKDKVSNERVRVQTQLEIYIYIYYHKREKTEMARARSANGRQQTAKTSCTLGHKRSDGFEPERPGTPFRLSF